ncbi:MAG: helix-turn-helix domain-containing protein, partial [Clostridium sp.]
VDSISEEVLEGFMTYDWPGNVRELKNSIEGAMNMIEDGHVLTKEFFGNRINMIIDQESQKEYKELVGLDKYMNNVEREIIRKVYVKNKKNVSKTAEELMISRQNLQYKLKKHSLLQE